MVSGVALPPFAHNRDENGVLVGIMNSLHARACSKILGVISVPHMNHVAPPAVCSSASVAFFLNVHLPKAAGSSSEYVVFEPIAPAGLEELQVHLAVRNG